MAAPLVRNDSVAVLTSEVPRGLDGALQTEVADMEDTGAAKVRSDKLKEQALLAQRRQEREEILSQKGLGKRPNGIAYAVVAEMLLDLQTQVEATNAPPPLPIYHPDYKSRNTDNALPTMLKGLVENKDGPNPTYSLDLAKKGLREVPKEIYELKMHLEDLDLRHNLLESLPPPFTQLAHGLHNINVAYNHLTHLPHNIGTFVRLQTIVAHNNYIKGVPPSIGELSWLKTLDLSSNRVAALPAELCKLTWLEKLLLGDNKIKELPSAFGLMVGLKEVNLRGNFLPYLPVSIKALKNLVKISLHTNRLTELPDTFCEMTELRVCDLSCNDLVSLPDNFTNLAKLKILHLSNNKLTTLPKLHQLEWASEISLQGNPLPVEFFYDDARGTAPFAGTSAYQNALLGI